MIMDPQVVIGALLTLMIWSVLYKHNIFYRFVEHTMIGVMAGYGVAYYLNMLNRYALTPIMAGKLILVPGLVLGLLLYSRFFSGYRYLVRWPLAAMAGVAAGVAVRGVVRGYVLGQIQASINVLVPGDTIGTINNILVLVMIMASLSMAMNIGRVSPQKPGWKRYST